MRIVHAICSDAFAGVERHVARLAAAQAAGGDDVVVIGGARAAMTAALGDDVRHLPAATVREADAHLRTWAPGAHVVHTHMTAAEVAATWAALRLPGSGRFPPVVSTRHFARTRGSGATKLLTAAAARHRVAAQISISQYVANHVDGLSTVVHPGVKDRPDGLAAAQRDRTVLMVQRLEAEKATDVGIEIFARSGLAADGWRLVIAGDGAERARLESLAARTGAGPWVEFLGMRDDTAALMARAGLLLAPCEVEGLGLSVLEAMAAGLPVLAAASGGHLETLAGLDAQALYPVTTGDVPGDAPGDAPGGIAAAAHRLAALAADAPRRDAYAQQARQAQRLRFTPTAQARQTHAVYEEVL